MHDVAEASQNSLSGGRQNVKLFMVLSCPAVNAAETGKALLDKPAVAHVNRKADFFNGLLGQGSLLSFLKPGVIIAFSFTLSDAVFGRSLQTMRTNIYYWKCDSPLPVEEKKIYNEKYRNADISQLVGEIGAIHFPGAPIRVLSTGSQGNHYTYLLQLPETTYFFRADDGKIDDDYMDAESAVMALAGEHGLPVPKVLATDTSRSQFPVRYQIMAHVPYPDLGKHDKQRTLNRRAVGEQLGTYLAALHSITGKGFGFLNTEQIRRDGSLLGLDGSLKDYFLKRLPDHLGYLQDVGFYDRKMIVEMERLFQRHEDMLDIKRPALLHKDVAFWNMLGPPDRIEAIIDWDDAVLGDPVDDLAIVRCFYDEDVFDPLVDAYARHGALPNDFIPRLWLYVLRNMLWKIKIRHFMGYFDMDESFFIFSRENRDSLEDFSRARIARAMKELQKI